MPLTDRVQEALIDDAAASPFGAVRNVRPARRRPLARAGAPARRSVERPSTGVLAPVEPARALVRLKYSVELEYEVEDDADFVFNIQAAQVPGQRVLQEKLVLSPGAHSFEHADVANGGRILRVACGPGELVLRYEALVEAARVLVDPASIAETPVGKLPAEVLPFIYPSRYCESDKLLAFAFDHFGKLPAGYSRAQAICDWVSGHVQFVSGATTSETTAVTTLVQKRGVCRDFAHLMIALCRACNLPARFATTIDFGADPALGPQDFHAFVEVFLDGRWWMFDPSQTAIPMGFALINRGRDAADAAFCTLFGAASMTKMRIAIAAPPGSDGRLPAMERTDQAIALDVTAPAA